MDKLPEKDIVESAREGFLRRERNLPLKLKGKDKRTFWFQAQIWRKRGENQGSLFR